jgi:formylglycine-generating enzyme required for sulfatase activity
MIRKLKVAEGSNKVSAKLAGKGADMKGLAVKSKPKGSKVKVNGQEAKETQSAQAPIPLKAPRANVAKDVANVATLPASAMRAGEASKDCPECPELVPVPTGDFEMGTTPGSFTSDAPRRSVSITKNFSIGRQEITFAQWEACVADNGCAGYNPADEGWGKGNRPAINISWKDAQRYIEWLSKKTGKRYRLPTEAEWEYAARAGTGTAFWWGREAGKNNANCFDCGGQGGAMTQPVGSYGTNPLGLHDTAGNVWEWTEDCYDEESYTKFDNYPQAVRGGASCYRVVRGGAWDMMSSGIQSSFRYSIEPGNRANNVGFRVVRED